MSYQHLQYEPSHKHLSTNRPRRERIRVRRVRDGRVRDRRVKDRRVNASHSIEIEPGTIGMGAQHTNRFATLPLSLSLSRILNMHKNYSPSKSIESRLCNIRWRQVI